MNLKVLTLLVLMSSPTLAAIQTGKLTGTDNYGNPCWVNINEIKNEIEPLLISHEIKLTSNYFSESVTLTHPIKQVNFVFQPAPEYYTAKLLNADQSDPSDLTVIKSTVVLNIDRKHTPVSLNYFDNDGQPNEFRRRSYNCKFKN